MRIIAGSARSRTIQTPAGQDTRPTLDRVRESVFNILQMRVREARVLDLFSGSGAMALEALIRENAQFDLVILDPPYAMVELREVTEKIRPLLSENAMIVIEHDVRTMPHVADGYDAVDTRKYGIVGVTFFEPISEE